MEQQTESHRRCTRSCFSFVCSHVQDRSFAVWFVVRVGTMKTHDFTIYSTCSERSLCSDCASLESDSWLSSVEAMDHPASQAKDSARMAKRKLMTHIPLRIDSRNPDNGVFIEKTDAEVRAASLGAGDMEEELLGLLVDAMNVV